MQTQHTLAASGKTDEALLLAVLEGKLEAYGELYERYYPMARAIAFKHTSDVNRVDDIVSESFARILQALKNGKGPHSYMGGYLSTTIAHLAGEYGLLTKKEVPSEQEHIEAMGTLDETVVQLHESDEVISAFTSLPERWQTVLWMSEIEAKKPREIAAAIDLTPNAVSALAIRAKESLKKVFFVPTRMPLRRRTVTDFLLISAPMCVDRSVRNVQTLCAHTWKRAITAPPNIFL